MRPTILIVVLTVFCISEPLLHAQTANLGLIKQRAKEVTGQQPKAPPAGSAATASTTAAGAAAGVSADPVIAQAVQKLVADFSVIKFRKEVTPDLTNRLSKDLLLCARNPEPAQRDAITALAEDLVTALIGKPVTTESQRQLANQLASTLSLGTTPAGLSAIRDTLTGMGLSAELASGAVKRIEASVGPVA
ncbi:MAG TPA: hypothetical protein VK968_02455, partial [Roseimicrobium sp.]|nr:hypothetical protein [Roseimicrobium sp.]